MNSGEQGRQQGSHSCISVCGKPIVQSGAGARLSEAKPEHKRGARSATRGCGERQSFAAAARGDSVKSCL